MKGDIIHNDIGLDTGGAPAESYEPPLGGELLRWKRFAAGLAILLAAALSCGGVLWIAGVR